MTTLSYKYPLYPTSNQQSILVEWLRACTLLYNEHLALEITTYKEDKKFLSSFDLNYNLLELKQKYLFLYDPPFQILTGTNDRLTKAFKNFFRRVEVKKGKVGFPRFKAHTIDSITFPIVKDIRLEDDNTRISIPKLGLVKLNYHRNHLGTIKQIHIKRGNLVGEWYVILVCKLSRKERKQLLLPKVNKTVGIDIGIKNLVYTSDKDRYRLPTEELQLLDKELQKTNRKLSDIILGDRKCKKKDVKRKAKLKKEKLRLIIRKRKQQKRINNKKDYHLHCISKDIVIKYDIIRMEDLNTKQMMKKELYDGKKSLRRNISKSCFGRLKQYITYKAENAGRKLIMVNPKNTSKMCSRCGIINARLQLKDRKYKCGSCGLNMNRDYNAAINILNKGLKMVKQNNRAGDASLRCKTLKVRRVTL